MLGGQSQRCGRTCRCTNRMHTGRQRVELCSILRWDPSSLTSAARAAEGVPAYMLIGYPNLTRGPGFLVAAGRLCLYDRSRHGPCGTGPSPPTSPQPDNAPRKVLSAVRNAGRERFVNDRLFAEYDAAVGESLKLAGPDFMKVFDLSTESAVLRTDYGDGLGRRLLASRRMCEAGVRFIEVSHNMNFRNGTGWDTHNDGQLNQHLLIQELDQALAAMIRDLESRSMLDKTLIIINSEFGAPGTIRFRGRSRTPFQMFLNGAGRRGPESLRRLRR